MGIWPYFCLYVDAIMPMQIRKIMSKIEWTHNGRVAMMATPQVWNLDWDTPDGKHQEGAITVASREEALGLLQAWVESNPDHLFKVYKTHGGVRAYCVSHPYTVDEAPWDGLKVDPLFIRQMKRIGYWRTRVSPKPNRGEKTVYKYWCDVGTGKAHKKLLASVQTVLQQSALNSI